MCADRDSVFLTLREAETLSRSFDRDDLIGATLRETRERLERLVVEPILVPPSGPGGGVAHERHKRNYQFLFDAGRFWMITGDQRWFEGVRDLLLAYAEVYERFPLAVPCTRNPPGRLFHQILNEHMWSLFAAAGYSCVRDDLGPGDREAIEGHLFEPMVRLFTETHAHHFDIIHNHGMWASAAVGVAGIATGREEWVETAVHGRFGDDTTAGFLAQLSALFSPSGYYEEGPYYQRFAIQPMLLFAEALERARPELGIYQFNDAVVRRGFWGALAAVLPDGALLPINDALKRMNIDSLGYVLGASLMYRRKGPAPELLWLAAKHGRVWLDGAGVELSDAVRESGDSVRRPVGGESVELTCGPKGDRGAIGILRATDDHGEPVVVSLDYGSFGPAEHAHFDGLTLGYFARGREVLRDYGAVRWINVEPKLGGSYLPENATFAKQTIAHNTVTVDKTSQFGGNGECAGLLNGRGVRFQGGRDEPKMMIGVIEDFSPGVTMKRSVTLLEHGDFERPLLLDLFHVSSRVEHLYDYALYYEGQVIRFGMPHFSAEKLRPLDEAPGYRHLWRLGSASCFDGHGLFSWLQGDGFHTLVFSTSAPTEFISIRVGAGDPEFNLRPETGLVLRLRSREALFASVLENHGFFDEGIEMSRDARGKINRVEVLRRDENLAALRLAGEGEAWLVGLVHGPEVAGRHRVELGRDALEWSGGVHVRREREE